MNGPVASRGVSLPSCGRVVGTSVRVFLHAQHDAVGVGGSVNLVQRMVSAHVSASQSFSAGALSFPPGSVSPSVESSRGRWSPGHHPGASGMWRCLGPDFPLLGTFSPCVWGQAHGLCPRRAFLWLEPQGQGAVLRCWARQSEVPFLGQVPPQRTPGHTACLACAGRQLFRCPQCRLVQLKGRSAPPRRPEVGVRSRQWGAGGPRGARRVCSPCALHPVSRLLCRALGA